MAAGIGTLLIVITLTLVFVLLLEVTPRRGTQL